MLEDQSEFGRGEQAFEALLVGERGGPARCGRRRRAGFDMTVIVGFDRRERWDSVMAAAVEQGT